MSLLLLLVIISQLKNKTAKYKTDFRLPLFKKVKKQRACLRARNLYRYKYIYGYDSDIAKRAHALFHSFRKYCRFVDFPRSSRINTPIKSLSPVHGRSKTIPCLFPFTNHMRIRPTKKEIYPVRSDDSHLMSTPFVIRNNPSVRITARVNLCYINSLSHRFTDAI